MEEAADTQFIVASGSLPPGVPPEIFTRIADIAMNKNVKLIVDTSGEALKYAINEGVYIVKPNLNELGSITGKPVASADQIIEAAKQIVHEKIVKWWWCPWALQVL